MTIPFWLYAAKKAVSVSLSATGSTVCSLANPEMRIRKTKGARVEHSPGPFDFAELFAELFSLAHHGFQT
jgi:hypothetical protein